MAEERGLPELLDALRWRWKLVAAMAAAFFVVAVVYIQTLPSEYDGKTVISVAPRPNVATVGADTVRVVGPKYVAYVEAPKTAQDVSALTGIAASTLAEAVDASIAPDTGNVTITVRLRSPDQAARAANAYAAQVERFSQTDPLLTATTVAQAVPQSKPAAPPRRLLEVAALLVGTILAVGVSVLVERGRPRLRSWRDMTKVTGYPVVGRVPPLRSVRFRPTDAFSDPRVAAAFRTLRANLEPQLREQNIEVIVVSSPGKSDGKTTVAVLAAEALARLGSRVLLVDADLRRPRIARVTGVDGQRGLAAVLRRESTLYAAIQPGWVDDLKILPTEHDDDAGDLLARRFAEVIEAVRKRFDLIVVDTPPLIGTDDARAVLPVAEGVLLVVAAGSTADAVNEAVLAVESLKAPLLGIVGNRLPEPRDSYYYE